MAEGASKSNTPSPRGRRGASKGPAAPKRAAAPADSDPGHRPFLPEVLDRTVIAIPLLDALRTADNAKRRKSQTAPLFDIIIDLNLRYRDGRTVAKHAVVAMVTTVARGRPNTGVIHSKTQLVRQYVFARLDAEAIRELVRLDDELDSPEKRKAAQTVPGLGPSSGAREPSPSKSATESDDDTEAPASGDGASPHTSEQPIHRAIYRIWPDFKVKALLDHSVRTVKADAARNSYSADGSGVVWAVLDSGIDGTHPHFAMHKNLVPPPAMRHRDFTAIGGAGAAEQPLVDRFGHGTHVAGIIAGEMLPADGTIMVETRSRDEKGEVRTDAKPLENSIRGVAPRCKLISYKVLDDRGENAGEGLASSLIAALYAIQEVNANGRDVRIHGVNMSVGYDFEPEWFACGHSPLCNEVDRLVRSGVVVVVAAGNTGYGFLASQFRGSVAAGMDLTINDPGNAERAITVGSTHRDSPHLYGVSYFSSKGPTGDGRMKPDLVAPGEKIVSCDSAQRRGANAAAAAPGGDAAAAAATVAAHESVAAAGERGTPESATASAIADAVADAVAGPTAAKAPVPVETVRAAALAAVAAPAASEEARKVTAYYREESGTSMAAPHVSGAVAAFLSVREEFKGDPERVKSIFMASATDLKRDPLFQGRGLVDLMRAIQSV